MDKLLKPDQWNFYTKTSNIKLQGNNDLKSLTGCVYFSHFEIEHEAHDFELYPFDRELSYDFEQILVMPVGKGHN